MILPVTDKHLAQTTHSTQSRKRFTEKKLPSAYQLLKPLRSRSTRIHKHCMLRRTEKMLMATPSAYDAQYAQNPKSPASPPTKQCQTGSCTDTPLPSGDQLLKMLRTRRAQSHGNFAHTVTNCFRQRTECSTCAEPSGIKARGHQDQTLT